MWAASFYGNLMPYQFGNCPPFPLGNFNSMAPFFNYMAFPPANMFTFPCGSVCPVPPCIPYVMAPGNFVPFTPFPPSNFNAGYYQDYKEDHRRGLNTSPARKAKAVPPPSCNFDNSHYQMKKEDHPRSLNASPAQKVRAVSPVNPSNFNDGHSRRYEMDRPRRLSANLPRNSNGAFQRSSRPSVRQFTENPKRYWGFVLVMVISTGKMEILNWREAGEKGKQVKIVST